ncbi:ATP-binding cassette domain-containing protein [Granulicatella sp. 19428wC4_WM01]|uniref:ABC transporter ATP-binding protein n=1 Tax=Granulicatella sp. 19428wC4_WM01 TaxID=2782471 RepID=UPI0010736A2A|nr:ATP-binding cassette domain-containing protein [Granulicatella sp. 19428wC4_WM01]TFU96335.1 ATP-binding cassette domain-containing protein [Granulicatella sp. WM01]
MGYIVVKKLNKSFLRKRKGEVDTIHALKNISFELEKSEIVGYLGLNGAGKSTTIKILSGILKPDSGSVTVGGVEPYKNRKRYVKNIGVMFGQRSQLEWDLPAIDTYLMLKQIYNIPTAQFWDTFNHLSELLDMDDIEKIPVRHLSLGQKTKCEILATFLHRPSLVFLDEPTIGLDIKAKENIHKVIKSLNKEFGTTIFITSHDLSDIEKMVDRVLIINKGELFYDGSLKNLIKDSEQSQELTVEISEKSQFSLSKHYKVDELEYNKFKIKLIKEDNLVTLINELMENNEVISLKIDEPTLESVLINLYDTIEVKEEK